MLTRGMLHQVAVKRKSLRQYLPLTDETVAAEIQDLAGRLKGARVLHLNSTAYGGGVAELLMSLVGLEADAGLGVEWRTIGGDEAFFKVTKDFHNALQGKAYTLTAEARTTYLDCNAACARALEDTFDVIIVHDPQPVAIRHFAAGRSAHWIWRCHIDTAYHPTRRSGSFLSLSWPSTTRRCSRWSSSFRQA